MPKQKLPIKEQTKSKFTGTKKEKIADNKEGSHKSETTILVSKKSTPKNQCKRSTVSQNNYLKRKHLQRNWRATNA